MSHYNTQAHNSCSSLDEEVPVYSFWIQTLPTPPTVIPSVPTVYKEAEVLSAAFPDPILLQLGGEVQGCGTLKINYNQKFNFGGGLDQPKSLHYPRTL